MRFRFLMILGAVLWAAPFAWAIELPEGFDVYILGEVHDNPGHHATQAKAVAAVAPRVVVFEMLTAEEAAQLADIPRDAEAMAQAVDGFHWSNIADYADILALAPVVLGAALPREDMRQAFADGAAAVFGSQAAEFGLTEALPAEQLDARRALQDTAHCGAMPSDMLDGLVEAQRLRDATFAKAVIVAADLLGTPVVLITGNGHARTDWGVPAYLVRARPDLTVFALGQSEDGAPPVGTFDAIADAPAPERDDPCLAFR